MVLLVAMSLIQPSAMNSQVVGLSSANRVSNSFVVYYAFEKVTFRSGIASEYTICILCLLEREVSHCMCVL